jgi:dihydrofolate reductase
MGKVLFSLTTSLDGFVAGPEQSVENPLGIGGRALHDWAFALAAWRKPHGMPGGVVNASTAVAEETQRDVGAYVMGRNMFGGHPGPWRTPPWNGWWGDNPPFHAQVFVVTHHPREPLSLQGGTTFSFVTEGIAQALALATRAAAGRNVVLAGGASLIQQCLGAGLVDEVNVSVVPILLGRGERLFANLGDPAPRLEQVRVVAAPGVTHLKYRVFPR